MIRWIVLLLFCLKFTCQGQPMPAAYQMNDYLPLLKGKRVGLVVNHTSRVANRHLADTLLTLGVNVAVVFAPEHGFRGQRSAGEAIADEITDSFPVYSLYGKNKKPTPDQIKLCDVMLFDIQDVGTRFYTYISTLHYVIQSCAENDKLLIVLDRPNPNGHYIDGPVLDTAYRSFVGMHPIPVVHGLTVGELAKMILGERWHSNSTKWDKLKIIRMNNYSHSMPYALPLPPSPNLPNRVAVSWYPTLCLFEGTSLSVGRGTTLPFQVIGHPLYQLGDYTFTPLSNQAASAPPHENKLCYGIYFEKEFEKKCIDLELLISVYQSFKNNNIPFFTDYFNTLAGTNELRKAIETGKSPDIIRASWQVDLENYRKIRSKYLLYSD